MLYQHYLHAKPIEVTGVGSKGVIKRVVAGPNMGTPSFVMRIFTIEKDGYTPHHAHPYEHGIVVLKGNGKVLLDDREYEIGSGSVITIPPNVPHQIVNGSDSELAIVCVVPAGADPDAVQK